MATGQAAPTATSLYNQGTESLTQNNPALARSQLEAASALAPLDRDIAHNLYIAKRQLAESTRLHASSGVIDSFVYSIYSPPMPRIIATMPHYLLRGTGCLFALFATTLVLKSAFKHSKFSWSGLSLFLIGVLLFTIESQSFSNPRAYSTAVLSLRSGPGDTFSELTSVPTGSELFTHQESGEWIQVTFGPDQLGWAKKSGLLLLPH